VPQAVVLAVEQLRPGVHHVQGGGAEGEWVVPMYQCCQVV
jgi:hypothetical protein